MAEELKLVHPVVGEDDEIETQDVNKDEVIKYLTEANTKLKKKNEKLSEQLLDKHGKAIRIDIGINVFLCVLVIAMLIIELVK